MPSILPRKACGGDAHFVGGCSCAHAEGAEALRLFDIFKIDARAPGAYTMLWCDRMYAGLHLEVICMEHRHPTKVRKTTKARAARAEARAVDAGERGLQHRVEALRVVFGASSDVVLRYYSPAGSEKPLAATLYVDGLIDTNLVAQCVAKPLARAVETYAEANALGSSGGLFSIPESAVSSPAVQRVSSIDEAARLAVRGHTIVLSAGDEGMLACDTVASVGRPVEEPSTESSVRGSREGFVETLRTNTAMIRQHISDPRLRIEETSIGRTSHTRIAVAYVDGIVNHAVLNEVRERLEMVDVDAVHESGHLEELIEDAPYSIFPTMWRTERPDRVAAGLLEGRIAILVSGTPFVLIVPATFTMYMTAAEDYYERYFHGSFIRLIRTTALWTSMLLPGLYVAITTFHQEVLPTPLIMSIAAQREGVPFPAVVESLVMELMFEVVREAGVRLPRLVGPAVSIVGVLVLGDAAIRSGIVSPIMVIIVASTGVASFAAPSYSMAIGTRLFRFGFLFLGATLGLYGIGLGLFALLAHLAAMESFGTPFLAPLAPIVLRDLQDSIIRFPWWSIRRRPETTRPVASRRARGEERQ